MSDQCTKWAFDRESNMGIRRTINKYVGGERENSFNGQFYKIATFIPSVFR